MPNIKTNRLWLARKRLGLGQKQVAKLLADKSVYELSRYENGQRLPSLKIAIKFSIMYRVPVRILFPDCYKSCFEELILQDQTVRKKLGLDITEPTDACSYVDIMNARFFDESDKEKIRRHIKLLMDGRRVNVLNH